MKSILLSAIIFLSLVTAKAQVPGIIIKPADAPGKTVLDPNGDGYVSKSTSGFSVNDVTESELPFSQFVSADPSGDILSGPTCSFMDIVGTDASGSSGIQIYNDGTNLIFRFRLSGYSNNSKAYSVLIDADQKFGFTGNHADPNAIAGNAGFEVEVVLETNFGVEVYNVDGTTSGTLIAGKAVNPYSTHCQKSMAVTTACDDPDYFYDFYIPISQLTGIAGLGITTSTPLRFAAVTNMSPHPSIGSHCISDINGTTTSKNLDDAFTANINNSTPTSLSNLITDGILQRSACPFINSVSTSLSAITGTTTESTGTVTISVYQSNGTTLLGSSTTSISSGTWTVNIASLTPAVILAAGQIIKASLTATNNGTSYDDCNPVTVVSCSSVTTNKATVSYIGGSKGYSLATTYPIGTIITWYNSDFTLATYASGWGGNIPNPVTTSTVNETVEFRCKTGQCFTSGNYYFTFQEPSKCVSDFVSDCHYGNSGTSATPTITTSPITTSTTAISGTCASVASPGTLINLYSNGTFLKSTTTISATSWTITGLDLSSYSCGTITVKEADGGKCPANGASGVTITRQAVKPIINYTGCAASSPVTSITGFSSEPAGSTITLYKTNGSRTSLGTTTVQSDGTWTKTGLNIVSADIIVAVATGNCVTASNDSDPVTISTQTSVSSYTISITTTYEQQTSVSGTISGGTYPVTVKIYNDSVLVGSNTVVASAGAWTVSGLNSFDLAAGSKIQVTVTASSKCESSFSSVSAIVQCNLPSDKTISIPSSLICYGSTVPITVKNSEYGTIYQLYKGLSKNGSSVLGTGSDITLNSDAVISAAVFALKANKISPVSCNATLTGNPYVNINQVFYSQGNNMIDFIDWLSDIDPVTGLKVNSCAFIIPGDMFIIPVGVTSTASGPFTSGADVTVEVDGVANFSTYPAVVPHLINNGKVQFGGASNGFAISTGTVEYNGTNQNVGSGTYYTLMISGSGTKILTGDVTVNNIFDLHTAGYVDLNGHKLTINNWADGHIPTTTADRYIILNGGTITVNGVNAGETIQFPMSLSTAQTDYCRVDVLNNDNAHTTFTISNVFNYSNDLGTSSGGTQNTTNWVNLTYDITSLSTNAVNTLFWEKTKELPGLTRNLLQMNHHNGTSWEKRGTSGPATIFYSNGAITIYSISAATNHYTSHGVGNDGSTLPIEMSSFTVQKEANNLVKLNWVTQTEINNNYFNVERSLNGVNWESINSYKGAGTSTVSHSYTSNDTKPSNGINYYRIKQTDFDGHYTYSSVKNIDIEIDSLMFDVFPNPGLADDQRIIIQGKSSGTITINVNDIEGRLISSGTIEISKTKMEIRLSEFCTLKPGTYSISFSLNDRIINKKIVVQ
jgi:hypothetical protein